MNEEQLEAEFKAFLFNNLNKIEEAETKEAKATAIFDMIKFYFTTVYNPTVQNISDAETESDEAKKDQAA